MDLLKCKVQWYKASFRLHGVRAFSLGACGDGARRSRAVPAIRLTRKKTYVNTTQHLGFFFYNTSKKGTGPKCVNLAGLGVLPYSPRIWVG